MDFLYKLILGLEMVVILVLIPNVLRISVLLLLIGFFKLIRREDYATHFFLKLNIPLEILAYFCGDNKHKDSRGFLWFMIIGILTILAHFVYLVFKFNL